MEFQEVGPGRLLGDWLPPWLCPCGVAADTASASPSSVLTRDPASQVPSVLAAVGRTLPGPLLGLGLAPAPDPPPQAPPRATVTQFPPSQPPSISRVPRADSSLAGSQAQHSNSQGRSRSHTDKLCVKCLEVGLHASRCGNRLTARLKSLPPPSTCHAGHHQGHSGRSPLPAPAGAPACPAAWPAARGLSLLALPLPARSAFMMPTGAEGPAPGLCLLPAQ